METRLRLDACAEDLRGFEWRHLAIALDSSLRRIDIGAPVTAVAATADGRFAAAGTEDGRIALVGLADGPPRRDLLPAGGPKVLAVAFGTGGQELFAVDDDQTLRVFGVADGALRRQRPRTGAQERLWLPRDVDRIVCETSPSHVSVLDPVDLTPRTPVVLADSSWTGNGRMVVDGDDLVAGSRQGVLVWSLRDGSRKRSFPVGEIRARSAGPRGDLVAGDVDGAILVIDRTTGTERRYDIGRRRIGDAQFVRDGRYLIAPCDTGEVLVFDLTRGGLPRSLLGHLGRVEAAAAIGDGSTFVTGGADGAVRLSHAVLGNEQVELIGIGEGRGLGIDGRGRLLTGDDDAVLSAVDVDTGAVVYRAPHEHWVNAVAGLPAEDLTVSAFGSVLRFWAAGDGAPRGDLALPAGFGMVTHIAPGEGAWRHRCAVGSREGRIAVVDTAARTVLAAHPAHDGMVTGLAFDAERQRFLSAGVDGRLLAVDAAAPDAGAREVLRAATRFRALAVAADRLFTSEEVRADGGGVLAERDPTTAAVRRSTPVGDAVVAIASIDRQRLAVGTAHGHVAIWDVAMLAPVFEQPLFPRGVRNVVAGPAGDWVAAIGYGGAPRILWARAPAEGSTALGQERQRVADLRQVADEAMAWTAWRPAAERRIRADQRLRAADRELAAACLPPVNAWSIASACYDEFASRVGTRPHEGKWRERYLLLQEIVHGGVGGHAVFCRCALALGAVRCGEPRVAVAALDGLVLTANSPDRGDGWFRPGYHFALGMAHLQLGERAAARAERDALQRLLAGEFAADRRGWCFLDELERAIAAQ